MNRHLPTKHTGITRSKTSTGWSYEVSFTDSNGRRRWKVCGPNIQDALDFQADIRLRLRKGETVNPRRVMFGQVCDEWLASVERTATASTMRAYRLTAKNYLKPRWGDKPIQRIGPDDIVVWLDGLVSHSHGKPLSGSSKQSIYTALHQVFQYGCSPRRGYLSHNPCDALEHGEKPRPEKLEVRTLTGAEMKKLLAASPQWLQEMIVTMQYTGTRVAETMGLRWQDVDFDAGVITVRGQLDAYGVWKPTKGKEQRQIELFPPLRRLLVGMPSRFQGGYVFVTDEGKPYWYARVRENFARARDAAGITAEPRPLRMHDLRHTFASALLRDGKDVAWVSGMLGHKSIQTTLDTYTHVIERQDRSEEAVMRLKEAFGE